MVPEKRKLMVVAAAVAAALALPGCAPAGYNAAHYGVEPAANAVDATPTAEPDPSETAEAGAEDVPAPSEDDITSELTGTKVKRMGKVVVDQEGWVLYRFDDDKNRPAAKSTCDGDCAKVWPPAYTEDGKPEIKGVDSADVGTVTRSDGTKQLTLKGWPLYRYAGDREPGQWRGQNIGAKWFVINPDGSKNLTCLPKAGKPIAPPADDDAAATTEKDDSGSAGSDYSY